MEEEDPAAESAGASRSHNVEEQEHRMIRSFRLLTSGIAVAVFAAATLTSRAANAAQAVYVADVEQLYASVDNPANAGASVALAPGMYLLSSTDPAGIARANRGRLELQKDMSLYGVAGDRAAVVIDAGALPRTSFSMPFGRTGVIRTGRGSNAVEWLTIAGTDDAAAAVETDLVENCDDVHVVPCPTRVRVAHVAAGDSSRGVDVRNIGAVMAGRRVDAEIVDSEFFRGIEGIRAINLAGADHGDISVVMSGNRSYQNFLGCIAENNRSSFASIYVRSSGDRFEDNMLGCQIGGGLVVPVLGSANSNSVVFEAFGSQFIDNRRVEFFNATGPDLTQWGGLLVEGGTALGRAGSTNGNTATVRLWGCKVAGNLNMDFQAFGAHSGPTVSDIAGTDNHVIIELHGVSKLIDVVAVDSSPSDPSGSNTATVIR
jgi:hypothetical protein